MSDHAIDAGAVLAALKRGELVYYYQPRISLVSGRVCGAEALLRWLVDGHTVRLPDQFLPQLERAGLMPEVALGMLPTLTGDLMIIGDVFPELRVSFNLCGQDLEIPEVVRALADAVHHRLLDPHRLEAEITESSVIDHDNPAVHRHLGELIDLGISLSMDDYGTGYSSINTLSRWPFNRVKIDQGLIRRLGDSEKCATIVQASVRMAHELNIGICAEGIESAESYDFLLHAGCTEAQGFWLGRPMPLYDFLSFVRTDRRWSGLPTGLIHMAILDHVSWRQRLVTQVTSICFNGGDRQPSAVPELDHHRCKLGRWYYGEGQGFKGNPLFDGLEEPHHTLHELGAALLEGACSGESRNQLERRMRELSKQSSRVLELLQDLESEALIDRLQR